MNRSIKALLLVAAILTLSQGAFAQDRQDPPLITVTGQAEVLVVPDEVVFKLTVETVDKDLPVAQAKNDQTVKSVFALARKYQIPPTQMQTSQIRLEKKYSSEEITKKPPVFLGYSVTKKVALILRDVSKADELLADIFKSGVTEIDDVDFRTTQIRKYKDQARALAIKAAQEKAIALTKEIGQSIGKAYSISESSFPIQALSNNYVGRGPASASYSDDESTIALGQISITASVVVSFELK